MKLNIDDVLKQALPWDFVVTVGGQDYRTRRPVVGQMTALVNNGGRSVNNMLDLVQGLFEEPAPDIRQWNGLQFSAFISAYMAFFNQRVDQPKKAEDAVAEIAIALVTQPESGASEPKN